MLLLPAARCSAARAHVCRKIKTREGSMTYRRLKEMRAQRLRTALARSSAVPSPARTVLEECCRRSCL